VFGRAGVGRALVRLGEQLGGLYALAARLQRGRLVAVVEQGLALEAVVAALLAEAVEARVVRFAQSDASTETGPRIVRHVARVHDVRCRCKRLAAIATLLARAVLSLFGRSGRLGRVCIC
jgi:hypothetical protein